MPVSLYYVYIETWFIFVANEMYAKIMQKFVHENFEKSRYSNTANNFGAVSRAVL